jgi:hypothetical protein
MATDEVLPALKHQLDCYQRLAKLANTQHDHVQNSLEEMAQLEKIIAPAKRNWKEYAEALPVDQRSEAELLVSETRLLLEEIAAADRDDTIVLQQRKFNLGRGINQATAARKFNGAYARAAYGNAKAGLDTQR